MTPPRPPTARASVNRPPPGRPGFTLIELMTVLIIFSIFSSLSLAGLALSRQRAKAVRTETTIRKIHEVVMPHYERYLGQATGPQWPNSTTLAPAAPAAYQNLIKMRRLQAIELPDDWRDLNPGILDPAWNPLLPGGLANPANLAAETGISRRLREIFNSQGTNFDNVDAECLWAIVMQGGFGDPGIIGHFREDEFGDTNNNGLREFVDGWGNPIRFLRWAPGFVSKYQPAAPASAAVDTRSHDVFDAAAIDPFARITLFPLIFSGGPNEEPDILHRASPDAPTVHYPNVRFDPYFATRGQGAHLKYGSIPVAPYTPPAVLAPFGTQLNPAKVSDDIHNHALSR
jgi:prepilin-type N-terminal cleavage/methylation domain-containing protein